MATYPWITKEFANPQLTQDVENWKTQLAGINPETQPTLYGNIQKNIKYYSPGGAGYEAGLRDWQAQETESTAKSLGLTTTQLMANPQLYTDKTALAKYTTVQPQATPQTLGTQTPVGGTTGGTTSTPQPTYYWTIVGTTAKIVDASGNPVPDAVQTQVLSSAGWDFTKIPKYGATTPTTPAATTSQPVAPSPISGATPTSTVAPTATAPTEAQPQYSPLKVGTVSAGGQWTFNDKFQWVPVNKTTPTTPKTTTPTTQTTPQIEAIQAQLKDLQAQQAAMTQYGVSDTNMLEKDAEGNYVPKEVAPKTPDQVRDEVYTKYGIDTAIKDWANAPTKSFEEIYKEILTNSGIADITANIQKITDDINKADADYNTAVGDINDNPWISEAGRVGKIEKLNINYEQTRKRLDNQLTLATGQQDKLKEEASRIATEALTAYDKQHQYDKAVLDFYITRAEAEIEAELTAQTEEQKFRYETYPAYLKTMKELTAPEVEKPVTVSAGSYLVNPSTGEVIFHAPEKTTGDLPTGVATRVDKMSSQFDNEAVVKQYASIVEQVDAVKNAGVNPTDDIQRIYAFAKVMDPTSVVREGEYKTVEKYAQALIQHAGKSIKRVFDNAGFLTEEARSFMLTTLEQRLKSSEKSYMNVFNEYGRRINMITGNTDGTSYITDYSKPYSSGQFQVTAPDGVTYSFPSQEALNNFKKEAGIQ
jgi:hypothetical protein